MQAALSYKNIRLFCAGGRYAKIAKPCLRSIGCLFDKLVILFKKEVLLMNAYVASAAIKQLRKCRICLRRNWPGGSATAERLSLNGRPQKVCGTFHCRSLWPQVAGYWMGCGRYCCEKGFQTGKFSTNIRIYNKTTV